MAAYSERYKEYLRSRYGAKNGNREKEKKDNKDILKKDNPGRELAKPIPTDRKSVESDAVKRIPVDRKSVEAGKVTKLPYYPDDEDREAWSKGERVAPGKISKLPYYPDDEDREAWSKGERVAPGKVTKLPYIVNKKTNEEKAGTAVTSANTDQTTEKKEYIGGNFDKEGYLDYLRKRTALSSFYGRMEQYQKERKQRAEQQRQDAIRESMKHEQDDIRTEKQYRRWLDDKEKYDKAVAAQTARDVRGDDVRMEKQYTRAMDALEQQRKALDKQRQFDVSGNDVRQEKQYKRYLDALEQQKKLQAKANRYAVSGDDVRQEKKYNRYLDKKADYEQQRKEFMDYLGAVGKSEKEMTRAESRYQSAVNSWDKMKQEKPENEEIGDLEKQLEDYLAAGGKQQKNSNNVFFGDMDQGTWGSARPEGVSQSWLIKNIDKQRNEMETAKESGLYDNSNDVSLWSTKKREGQKRQNLEDELRIQSEIDEINRRLEAGVGTPRMEDEEVQRNREILMGDYSDEEKEAAQARLEEIYEQGELDDEARAELVEQRKNKESQLRYIRAQNKQIDDFNQRMAKREDLFKGYTPNDTNFHSDIEDRYDFGGNTDVAYIYQLLEEKQLNGEHQIFGEKGHPEAYLMDDKETKTFVSLVNENKIDEAWAFYTGLRPYLNQLYSKYEASMWEDAANRFPILSFFAARGANVLQIPQFVMNVPGYIEAMATGKDNYATDAYGSAYAQSRIKNLIDNQISNNAGDYGWVYRGFASGVDSAINASIAQGLGLPEKVQFGDHIFKAQNVAMLSLFASQAFETSLQNVMAQGNNNFAYDFVEAFVDSVIETATEIWSVENFLADPTNILTYITKLAISEPSEEVAGAIIEPFIKEMIGHGNQYKVRADEIWHNGFYEDANGNKVKVSSFDEAERQAMREWNHDIRMAAQEALISVAPGGLYGAAKMTSENRSIGRQVQETQFENGTTGLENMLENAQQMEPGTKSFQEAQKISERLQQEKKPGDFRVGQLARDMMRESQEQAIQNAENALRNEVRKELAGKEIKGSSEAEMTDLIVKAINGGGIESLTKKEREKIHDSSIGYNTLMKFSFASEQSSRAVAAQTEATAKERQAMQSVSDALTQKKTQTAPDDFVGKQLATQDDIDRAEGKRTKQPDEVIVDRKFARLDGMELVDTGDGKQEWKYKVHTENGTEYKSAGEIKATGLGTAAVIRQRDLNPTVYSGDFTNELLKQVSKQTNNQKIGRFMMEAEQVRWAAFLGQRMPKTSAMSEEQAKDFYRISQNDLRTEWQQDQATRTENFRGRGQGQAYFDGAEFGTEEWTKKLDEMDLSREERQLVDGLAAFAQDSGIRFDFVDQINGNDFVHGSENQGGIRIALQSYDSEAAKKAGQKHHIAVTVGHELTHWMRRNNASGYIELQDFVLRSMSERGINVAARAMQVMESRAKAGDNLTMTGAIEEIVANACDQTLGSEEGVRHLEETSPKLAEKIRNFVKDLVQRIKAAIGTGEMLNSASRDALRMVGEEANRLHKLWWGKFDETLNRRVQELQAPAEEGKEAASVAEEKIQFSQADDAEDRQIKVQLRNHINEIMALDPIADISSDVDLQKYYDAGAQDINAAFLAWATDIADAIGNKVTRDNFGDVQINKKNISNAFRYRMNTAQKSAFTAVPEIIKFGEEINSHKHHKNNANVDSTTFAGKIIMDGEPKVMAVTVKYTQGKHRYAAHKVMLPDGTVLTIDNKAEPGLSTESDMNQKRPIGSASEDIVTQAEEKSNFSMAELDAEYEEAVKKGDVDRAEQMLMDRYQQMEQQGVIGYRAPHFNNGEYAEIAKRIKTGDPEAIRSAARDMAQMVPENAVLIPMPPHSGQVTEDTDTMLLARAISEITGRPVINALAGGEHISRQEAKTNNIRGVDARSMGFTQIAQIPEDAMPVFIDNMVGGGVTAKAAHDAVGRGITLAYAQSARAKIGGAKFVGITKDSGELIPLSQRMDPDNKSWKYSMAEDDAILSMTDPDSASVGAWMMQQTPSSVHTEGERALIQEYRGLRTALDLTRKRLNDYNTQLKRLQAKKGMLTAEERATLTELEAKIQVQQDKQTRLEQELYDVTRGEGFAAMMYRNAQIYKDYIEGKNQVQVEAAVDRLMSEAEAAEKKIGARQKQLNRMSEEEAVKTVRRELRNRGLKQSAAVLKDSFFTTMSTGELEARLAEIALKAVNNEGPDAIRSAVESLAADIVASPVSMQAEDAQDNLRPLKGRTITFSPSEQAEMKAIGWTLADIRSKVKGSGVTVKFGDVSTLQADLDEIAKEVPGIRNELESGSAEQAAIALVDWIEGQMSRMKGNPRDYDIDPKSVEMIIVSCAKQLLDEKQGGMSRAALAKRIEAAAGELGKLTDAVNSLMESVQQIKRGAVQASNAAGGLRGDTAAAVDYYNLIARQAAEVERARVKRDVIEKLRSENTKKLIEQEMKFREQMKKDKRARELRTDNEHMRSMITTDVKRLKDRLVAETDQKNIQEEAKPLARALIGMFVDHDMAGFRRVLNADKKQLADVQMRLGKMQALEGEFDPDADLDFLVIKAPNAEDNDYSLKDKVLEDLMHIEQGLLEYRNAEGLGVVSLADRKAALEKIQEATSEIYDVIRARETAFIAGQKRNVMELATQMERDMANSRFKGERRGRGSQVRDWFWNDVGYGNLTPEYFFKNLRNRTLSLLHDGFHEAEKRSGLEARDAQRRIAQIAEECGYATWDGQEKKTVTLTNGKKIEMSVEQLMALYATWNREKNALRPEETSHLLKGGFVLAEGDTREGKARREKTSQRPIRVNETDLDSIGSYLTEQQKDFVDRIVGYMSSDLAQLGNEASLRTYGIKKFTETYYFPTKSWGGVLNKSSSAGVTNNNDNRAMRQSFSKRIRAGAQNALEIGDFTATAMKHITGMITFNTVGPAVENLNKVLNQQLDYYEDEEMDPDEAYKRNMRAAFQENYGKMAYDYLAQFMKDVNGGVARRNETIMREKLLSIFKKNAVAGSLSVAAQQPLSYIRAAMLINPKYLAAAISPQYWRGSYEEMMSHSGVAVIKDMGKFDMNFGQSMTDYITPEGMMKTKDRIKAAGDTLTALPGKMDAMTWTRMWSACKLEQAALHPEMDVKSEDFLDMVADRFEELMRRTQVYDSVMVKSQNMRSDNYLNKIRTSFMAEPTLSLNVLADAWINMKEKGGKANAAKALATFILSAAAQAGAKAFFGTGRSPDKKKTEEENFLNKFLQNLLSEANPLGLIPGYSQLVEVLINGELNDDAMGMIAKAKDATAKMVEIAKELATGVISGKGVKISYRDLENSVGQVVQIASSVPLKNFMRDFRAMVNWFSGGTATGLTGDTFAQRETSAAVLRQQSLENLMTKELGGLMNAMLGTAGYGKKAGDYVQRIYDAQKRGDLQEAEELREYTEKVILNGKDPGKWIDDQLNSLLKEDDSLSTEEKMDSLGENGYGSMGKYINEQYRAGEIDRKAAEEYYKKENPAATDKDVAKFLDKTDWEKDGKPLAEGQKNYTNYTPLYVAMQDNKAEDIRNAVEHMKEIGYEPKDIKKEVNGEMKKKYLAADANGRIRLKDAMQKAYKALGFTAEDADKTISNWTKEKK